MTGEAEAAGDVLTGGIVASAVEGASKGVKESASGAHVACRNCGATVAGAYCSNCGQAANIHRSLISLGHDILHGVFHFEGRVWRTIPELFLRPGRLTRRYIDGERAKFVSPMALFLFTVFVMFAVFSFTGGALLSDEEVSAEHGADIVIGNWRQGNEAAMEETEKRIDELKARREAAETTPEQRAKLDGQISDLESSRIVMEALSKGDFGKIAELDAANDAKTKSDLAEAASQASVELPGTSTLETRLNAGLKEINDNPQLLLYKLKTNGYKFSWALIPLSVPFMWLMFFWRRDIHLYDHAIFVTYSITFMMQLVILLSLAAVLGVSAWIWATALSVIPPIHIYKQLRGAYGLSRFGASVRLMVLFIFITIIVSLFGVLLLFLGVID
jgi:Protein of unknown function (DUF3667)